MKLKYLCLIFLLAVFCMSCEKRVDFALHVAEPRLVIDASMGFLTPCQVKLSLTQDYWNQEQPTAIRGAVVILSDGEGNSEILHEYVDEGVYVSRVLGRQGKTYTLTVEVDDEVYVATDRIPTLVPIEDLSLFKVDTGGDVYYYPCLHFTDPKDEDNYYLYILSINGKTMQGTEYDDDKYSDGLIKEPILFFDKKENNDKHLKIGDDIYIEMQSIGKGAHTFYKTARPPGGGETSSNPTSNFSGDVLGMFKTYNTVSATKTITEADLAN